MLQLLIRWQESKHRWQNYSLVNNRSDSRCGCSNASGSNFTGWLEKTRLSAVPQESLIGNGREATSPVSILGRFTAPSDKRIPGRLANWVRLSNLRRSSWPSSPSLLSNYCIRGLYSSGLHQANRAASPLLRLYGVHEWGFQVNSLTDFDLGADSVAFSMKVVNVRLRQGRPLGNCAVLVACGRIFPLGFMFRLNRSSWDLLTLKLPAPGP